MALTSSRVVAPPGGRPPPPPGAVRIHPRHRHHPGHHGDVEAAAAGGRHARRSGRAPGQHPAATAGPQGRGTGVTRWAAQPRRREELGPERTGGERGPGDLRRAPAGGAPVAGCVPPATPDSLARMRCRNERGKKQSGATAGNRTKRYPLNEWQSRVITSNSNTSSWSTI